MRREGGQLVVFPPDTVSIAVYDLIKSTTRISCKKSYHGLAYFLPGVPISSTAISKDTKRKFGSAGAQGVFLGGGPFVLEDSPDLVERAMRRMGYLDDAFNADLDEALFSFLNNSANKKTLRQLSMLPDSRESGRAVSEKLRRAFLSNRGSGHWYILRQGRNLLMLSALKKEGLISPESGASYSTAELFESMKVYARRHGLPPMRTFNGLERRIQQEVDRNPCLRSLIEVGSKARSFRAVSQ